MTYGLQTDGFTLEYAENRGDVPVLWENHCHAHFEMISVFSGEIRLMLEGRDIRMVEGQTVLIPPLCYHSIAAVGRESYRRMIIGFDLAAIPEVLRPRYLAMTAEIRPSPTEQLEELRRILREADPNFYAPLAHSLAVQILYRSHRERIAKTEGEEDEFLRRVISYIDGHLCERITLDLLAEHTARSKSSLCHLFASRMNISPMQYVTRKRLALADRLIRDGVPPTTASLRIGYDNYGNFYRMYRKTFGRTPAETEREHTLGYDGRR